MPDTLAAVPEHSHPVRPPHNVPVRSVAADSLLVRACRREVVAHTPVWLMRQAGRYMPEYRAIRARQSMLEAISDPAVAAEITLQPVDALGVDAAIIFSDILPPLIGMGLDLDFVSGVGPRISNPIRVPRSACSAGGVPSTSTSRGTLDAIRLVR
ncbi:MAG: uroporphyrinogen decarboxylase family protein, partial [Gemmatimonadales bacterium]